MSPAWTWRPAARWRIVLWTKLRTTMGVRFTRFARAALTALAASEGTLAICDGVFHLTAGRAAVLSWFVGAVVSYLMSRWAWERKGKPDFLRETVPFWVISALVVVILTLCTKLGYHVAASLHLRGAKHVVFVGFFFLVANFITFLTRFVIFHYVVFAEPRTAAQAAAADPDVVPPRPHAGAGSRGHRAGRPQ
jgi:putative flippase GtrA